MTPGGRRDRPHPGPRRPGQAGPQLPRHVQAGRPRAADHRGSGAVLPVPADPGDHRLLVQQPEGKFNYTWQGFTWDNWAHPFKYPALTDALKLSLSVAAVSTAVALVLGTLVAIALVRQRFRGSQAVDTFLVLPLTSPEVVMGASLLTLFLDLGWATGYTTIVIAHIAFQISFIAMTVRARIRGFDWTLEDASLDLGAGPTRTFFQVTLPLIVPGIVAAAMLSFALSLDDFIITYFVSGSTVTYPLYVNAAVKAAVPPQINVLATAILMISLVLLGVGTLYRRKRES